MINPESPQADADLECAIERYTTMAMVARCANCGASVHAENAGFHVCLVSGAAASIEQ